jgi:hypothetical protein
MEPLLRLKGHLVVSLAIQTCLSCCTLLAIGSLGLRRSGSLSQFTNLPQDFLKQIPGDNDQCSPSFGKTDVRMNLARL